MGCSQIGLLECEAACATDDDLDVGGESLSTDLCIGVRTNQEIATPHITV